eukprot:616843-Pyramimonas_sp.AAC.1
MATTGPGTPSRKHRSSIRRNYFRGSSQRRSTTRARAPRGRRFSLDFQRGAQALASRLARAPSPSDARTAGAPKSFDH